MCGIVGKLALTPGKRVDAALIGRMTASLRHRGPDDEGIWVDGVIGLGSRRLAIVDLSPRGRQPLTDESRSIHLVFNGEIYNFRDLRTRLEQQGHRFESATDTESLVHLYEEEGLDCLNSLLGMFAFALWDGPPQRLVLARDRLGKKPLVYYHGRGSFIFASEAKAILQDPEAPVEADAEAIHQFLAYGYVPAPMSAFRDFHAVPP